MRAFLSTSWDRIYHKASIQTMALGGKSNKGRHFRTLLNLKWLRSRNRRRNCKRYDSCHESVISSKAHERDSPEVEPESASVVSTANLVTDIINEAAQPKLSDQDRKLIIRSWKIIDSQISQVSSIPKNPKFSHFQALLGLGWLVFIP